MADDKAKKTKIDLKARLGKTQVGLQPPSGALPVPAGVTPPPPSDPGSGPGSVPQPPASAPASSVRPPTPNIAPPPGLSPGIPIPPFAQQQRPAPAAPAPKPTAAQQTIKVEIGEEIEIERKKWRQRVMLGALAGALIGAGLGFVGGGSKSTGDRARAAARGAGQLEKDVKATVDKLKDLDSKLSDASDKLKAKSYPDDLATALSGLTIPFDSTNLDGKDVGSLPPRVLKNVLNFTSAVEALNKNRESLKNIVSIAKEPINKAWKEETAPVANFSVVFRSEGGKTVVAELVPNKEPFSWKGDYPGSYKVTRLENGKPAEKNATRWVKGDLPGNDLTAIPVDPKSVAAFTSEQLIGKLIKGVYDMRQDLEGNKDNPTNETPGLVKMAEDLANELNKASRNQ
ncbi:MAG: formin [Minicystis sp.]